MMKVLLGLAILLLPLYRVSAQTDIPSAEFLETVVSGWVTAYNTDLPLPADHLSTALQTQLTDQLLLCGQPYTSGTLSYGIEQLSRENFKVSLFAHGTASYAAPLFVYEFPLNVTLAESDGTWQLIGITCDEAQFVELLARNFYYHYLMYTPGEAFRDPRVYEEPMRMDYASSGVLTPALLAEFKATTFTDPVTCGQLYPYGFAILGTPFFDGDKAEVALQLWFGLPEDYSVSGRTVELSKQADGAWLISGIRCDEQVTAPGFADTFYRDWLARYEQGENALDSVQNNPYLSADLQAELARIEDDGTADPFLCEQPYDGMGYASVDAQTPVARLDETHVRLSFPLVLEQAGQNNSYAVTLDLHQTAPLRWEVTAVSC